MKNKPLVSVEGAVEKPPIVKKLKPKTTFESITNPLAPSKDCSYMDYMSDNAFRFFPDKDKWRERFMASMYEWAFDDKSLEIMQFCMSNRVPYTTFIFWVNNHEDIGKAYKEVKLILATRRRLGAIHRQYDKEMILKDLYRYDPEWAEVDKYNAQLKKNESEGDRHLTVIMTPSPSVDSVKPREDL